MKRIASIILIGAVFAAGGFYLDQLQTAKRNQNRLAALQEQLRETEAQVAREAGRNEHLQVQLRQTYSQAAEKATEANDLRQTLAKAGQPSEPSPGAALFRDPNTRAMMKKQQFEAAERTIGQMINADLVQRLGLTDEQATFLKELLKKKAATGVEMVMALMSGELDDAAMAELGRSMKREKEAAEVQIKDFLGEERYPIFEWQENSQTERGRLKDFKAKFESAGQPLSSEQENELLLAMYDERRRFHFQNDYNDASNFDYEHLQEFFTDDKFNVFFQEMEQVNEKILQRAQNILSAEQLDRFRGMQQDQLEKSKMTIKMTQALFPIKRAQH
jgi:hypothetical protein